MSIFRASSGSSERRKIALSDRLAERDPSLVVTLGAHLRLTAGDDLRVAELEVE